MYLSIRTSLATTMLVLAGCGGAAFTAADQAPPSPSDAASEAGPVDAGTDQEAISADGQHSGVDEASAPALDSGTTNDDDAGSPVKDAMVDASDGACPLPSTSVLVPNLSNTYTDFPAACACTPTCACLLSQAICYPTTAHALAPTSCTATATEFQVDCPPYP